MVGHLRRPENELVSTRAAVVSLRGLLSPDVHRLDVGLRTVPERTVEAISDTVVLEDVPAWYDEPMEELNPAVADQDRPGLFGGGTTTSCSPPVGAVSGPPSGRRAAEVRQGRPGDPAGDRVGGRRGSLPARRHRPDLRPALRLGGRARRRRRRPGVRETYLVGSRDDDEGTPWRTGIGWPIFRLSRL